MLPFLTRGPTASLAPDTDPHPHLVLAHGAGAPMTSPFLNAIAEALAGHDITTSRFEFAYMAARRTADRKRPPPPVVKLASDYRALLAAHPARPGERRFIGGKSMGGRVASLIADELYAQGEIAGLVCLGYPFHPAGKPGSPARVPLVQAAAARAARSDERVGHLAGLTCPALIVQGTRDRLGSMAEVERYDLSRAILIHWLDDGDHDFHPRRSSSHSQHNHLAAAATVVARFMTSGRI